MARPAPHQSGACRVCAEPLKTGARKCIHCDSWQDWHRYLGVSSSVLALLVALVTVLTAALPVVIRAFEGNRSRVELDLQGAKDHDIFVAASNSGNRAGRPGYATLDFKDEFRFPLIVAPEDAYVGPGTLKPIRVRFDDSYSNQLSTEVANLFPDARKKAADPRAIVFFPPVPATLTVEVVQFGGACALAHFAVQLHCQMGGCAIFPDPAARGRSSVSRCEEPKG